MAFSASVASPCTYMTALNSEQKARFQVGRPDLHTIFRVVRTQMRASACARARGRMRLMTRGPQPTGVLGVSTLQICCQLCCQTGKEGGATRISKEHEKPRFELTGTSLGHPGHV